MGVIYRYAKALGHIPTETLVQDPLRSISLSFITGKNTEARVVINSFLFHDLVYIENYRILSIFFIFFSLYT